MSTDEKIAELRTRWCEWAHGHSFDKLLDGCESPIERLFVAALLLRGWQAFDVLPKGALGRWWDTKRVAACEKQRLVTLSSGRTIRCDFVFTTGLSQKFAVELDGFEFHSSKKDATRDKSRDRQLISDGYTPVRFTGSEVFADADACVLEVEGFLVAAMKDLVVTP